MRFWCPCFDLLNSYKGPDQVFFFLMTFSYLNFTTVNVHGKEHLKLLILELLMFRGFFVHCELGGLNQHP
jgi:hypothetical protein